MLLALSTPVAAQTGTVNLREIRTYYESAGSGRVVVLLHGFALNLREWDDQMKALSPHYRVIAYDRRGFGKSNGFPDPSAEPDDLRELLDSLGVRSAVLVGHSAGAGVALRFALAFGDRVDGLVLYPGPPLPGFPIPPSAPHPMARVQPIAQRYGMDSVWKFVASLPMFWNPPNRPDIEERIRAMLATYDGRDLLQGRNPSGRYPPPTFEKVKGLRTPTLFIGGEREWPHALLVADSMARWMPSARSVVIPGGAHGVHLAEPERFNAALVEFLRSLPPERQR
jgi:pimeloyl-ACP methyl ester carboxylesterase